MSAQLDFNPTTDRNPTAFTTTRDRLRQLFSFVIQAVLPTTWVPCTDTGHWNTIDMNASTDVFYWLKATESDWYVDPTFIPRAETLLSRGKRIGVYHFFRANKEAARQVDWFLSNIYSVRTQTQGKILIGGDFETTDGVTLAIRQSRALAFLNSLQDNFRTPYMYSSQYLWQTMYGNPSWGNLFRGWVAQWSNISAPSAIPVGWDVNKLDFWQNGIWNNHSWVRSIPGGQPDIDNDYYMGTLSELDTLIGIIPEQLTLEQRVERLEEAVFGQQ